MLTLLHIENIAVVERAEIEFASGLNVLSGETGAGKSIVIDSLEAALGWRTSRELVRRGAKSALVTAVFSGADAEELCRERGTDYDGELILTRRIGEDGKSSCRVNGVPVPASEMREIGLRLIDIHGQGDGQRLTDERYHLEYLDGFGGFSRELAEYREAYRRMSDIRSQLSALQFNEGERERRVDMLSFQINEIERAGLTVGEYEETRRRRDFLKSAGKLADSVREASAAMSGGERFDGAVSLIESAQGAVAHALRWSEELAPLNEKLTDLRYAAEEAAEELRDMLSGLDVSPEELDALDERMDVLRRIFRKYGGSEEAALRLLDESREELDAIEDSDGRIKKLEGELSEAQAEATRLAGKLTALRTDAAARLSGLIEAELRELSMSGASFEVEIGKCELGADGADTVRFLIAANAGEAKGRISRVASGGELSRIMLAMKTILSRADRNEAMVFDEIDTGVSGIAAQRVAEKLAEISADKQVICVTHLPQIAAMADTQFSIEKTESDGRTYTKVTLLDAEGRRAELARLTGGEHVTETTLLAAAEQLDAAEKYKGTRRRGE